MIVGLDTSKFKFIGGNTGLDFVNSVAGRRSNPNGKTGRDYCDLYLKDKFGDYDDLVVWGFKAELLDKAGAEQLLQLAKTDESAAEKVLKRAVRLRESVYRLFKCKIESWQPADRDLNNLNRELEIARKQQRFAFTKDDFGFEWLEREKRLDAMLWQVALAAAELLATNDFKNVRQCAGDNCNWLFLDTSRNRSRNWCDMKDCGNLAKVRRFRERTANQTAS